jgi:hypothetical protein
MSDDLIKRLRVANSYSNPNFVNPFVEPIKAEAITRIEQLKRENTRLDAGWTDANARALAARLEVIKAVDVIKRILNAAPDAEDHAGWAQLLDDAAATLAELEGKEEAAGTAWRGRE